MIYKIYQQNKSTFVMAVVLISKMIFIAAPIANMTIIRNVHAADKFLIMFATIFLVVEP